VNRTLVDAINQGQSLIDEPGVGDLVSRMVREGRLSATADTAAGVANSDVIVVIVPALLTKDRDVDPGILVSVANILSKAMKRGCLVSFETTLPVGGTRRFLLPALESQGKNVDRDFELAFSPERVKSHFVVKHLTV